MSGYTCYDDRPYDGDGYTEDDGDLTVMEQCSIIRDNLRVIAILLQALRERSNEQ